MGLKVSPVAVFQSTDTTCWFIYLTVILHLTLSPTQTNSTDYDQYNYWPCLLCHDYHPCCVVIFILIYLWPPVHICIYINFTHDLFTYCNTLGLIASHQAMISSAMISSVKWLSPWLHYRIHVYLPPKHGYMYDLQFIHIHIYPWPIVVTISLYYMTYLLSSWWKKCVDYAVPVRIYYKWEHPRNIMVYKLGLPDSR